MSNRRIMVAASVLVLLLAGLAWWNQQDQCLYTTKYGEWKTVELPDGSVVHLNANTQLRLVHCWDDLTERKVRLSGEAYFEVKKLPGTHQFFQVITEDLTVEVMGTMFNVHSRGTHTEVFLEEGVVSLELEADTPQEMLLKPGQKVAYSKSQGAVLENGPASVALTTSWKDGLLKFDKTPMREVLEQVEDIYGITFRVEDETQYDRPITSQGVPIEKLEVTLPVLARALGLQVELENGIYVIE